MDDNIFNISRKAGSSKKKALGSNQEKETLPKNSPKEIDPEIKDMLQKMEGMSQDLQNQLDSVYRKGKDAKINVALLIEGTGSLSIQQFNEMNQQKKILENKINQAIPPESCLKKKAKGKEELTQERKGKMRGARNNWIPVK